MKINKISNLLWGLVFIIVGVIIGLNALDIADKGSVVLILGKGRDEYMAIEDKKPYYCDYDVIERYFKEK